MYKRLFVSVLISFLCYQGFAQQLPLGTCGIVNVYDANGSRTKREYFCNNGQQYPSKAVQSETKELMEFQPVDALYPNPTTGKFFITFSKPLKNATLRLTDINGKIVQQARGNGSKIEFDLSAMAAGVYFVNIEDQGTIISKKVVKQ
jgi:hypothetical protein